MKQWLAFLSFCLVVSLQFGALGAFGRDVNTECGGILILSEDEGVDWDGEYSAAIEYKIGRPYENNELCIWTVRAPQSNRIFFQLEAAAFESGYDGLYVHSYGDWEPSWVRGNATDRMRAPGHRLEVNGPLAFVVFSSDATVPGEGFQLLVQSSPRNATGRYPINCNYTDVYAVAAPESIRIPQMPGQPYNDYELTSIVLAAPTAPSLTALEQGVTMRITHFDLNNFDDRLYIYEVSREGWSLRGEFRYESEALDRQFTGRSFIVVFRSYNYYTYMHTGFVIEIE